MKLKMSFNLHPQKRYVPHHEELEQRHDCMSDKGYTDVK